MVAPLFLCLYIEETRFLRKKMKYFNFIVDMLCYMLYHRYTDKRGGEKMNNMRSYSLAFYPETKKKLEAIKDEKQLTWDELFNYLMEEKKEEEK